MKEILLLLIILTSIFVKAQERVKIIDFKYETCSIGKDFNKAYLLDKTLNDSVFSLEIFLQNYSTKLSCSANVLNDSLIINIGQDMSEFTDTLYDSINNVYVCRVTMEFENGYQANYGHTVMLVLPLKYKELPMTLNSRILKPCKNETKFDLYKCDTINRIDKLGMKQGIWVEFNDKGNIKTLDKYKNDRRINRYLFNEKGKTVSSINELGNYYITFEGDTANNFPNLPKVPEFKECNEKQ